MSGLPGISFKEFVKNPIVALLFIALMAVGYLYIDNRSALTSQIKTLQEEVKTLREDHAKLYAKFIDTLQEIND